MGLNCMSIFIAILGLSLSRNVLGDPVSIYYDTLEYEAADNTDWVWFGNIDYSFYNSQRCPGSWKPCPMIGESPTGSYIYRTFDEVDIHNYNNLTFTFSLSAYHLKKNQYCYIQYTYDTPSSSSATYTNLLPNLTSDSNTSNVEFINQMREIPGPPTDDPNSQLTIRFYIAPTNSITWQRCFINAVSLSGIFESPFPTVLPTYMR